VPQFCFAHTLVLRYGTTLKITVLKPTSSSGLVLIVMRPEVVVAVIMQIDVFWHVTPSSLVLGG
jgi:hypothetical protein